jgi:hypothetical protein
VNAGRAPSRVLGHHAKDQISNFFRDSSPTNHSACLGDGTPVECESRFMPSDHGLRSHDEESLLPSGAKPPGQDPEELIVCSESWPRVPALQCHELLAKGQVFKKQAPTRSEEAKDHSREEPNHIYHAPVLSQSACREQRLSC